MAGAVNVSIVAGIRLILNVSGVDRDAALALFRSLIDVCVINEVRIALHCKGLGDGRRQSGFTMVDVADGANVYMGFGSVEMLLCHLDCSSFYLRNFILLLFIKNRLFSAQGYFINSHKGLQAFYEIYSSPVFARELMIVSAMDFGTSV